MKKPGTAEYTARMHKPEEFKRFGLFMALPGDERKIIFGFTTEKQFAAKYGVRAATLTEWKQREDFWETRDRHLVGFKKHTAAVIGALAKRAERTGDAFHVLAFLKVVEGFTDKGGMDLTSKGKQIRGFDVIIHHAKNSPTSSRD